jgi:NCS1 family nucleobase:cation symporter-1
MESVRKFQDFCGPAIWLVMIALAVWILAKADWSISLTSTPHPVSTGEQWRQWFGAVGLILATYGTLMLNFCDFSRFAPSRRAVKVGNFWGLPVNFIAFSIVSVVVTAGSLAIYGDYVFDPVELVGRIDNTAAVLLGAVTFTVATIGINIVANFVSPAYDLANAAPRHIDFKRGGVITALLSIVVLPWKVFANPVAVNYFLGGLGAFLGPLFGIIITDYYLIRRGHVDIADLYRSDGAGSYSYRRGFNPDAVLAFAVSAAIAAVVALVPAFSAVAPFSWFIGAALGALSYYSLARLHAPSTTPQRATVGS